MNNITLLTYTHSKCADLHYAYFDRLNKYFPDMHNIVTMCNEQLVTQFGTNIVYQDETPYSHQMKTSLNIIQTDYVIYSQEDYILFDSVKTNEIVKAIHVMDNDPRIGFIRLIHSGLGQNCNNQYNDDYRFVDKSSEYYYSTQIAIWRKPVLLQMFTLSNVGSIFDEPLNSAYLRQLDIYGLYEIPRGKQVGNHYNSYSYPYIATAKTKGRWNIEEYPAELSAIFKEYQLS